MRFSRSKYIGLLGLALLAALVVAGVFSSKIISAEQASNNKTANEPALAGAHGVAVISAIVCLADPAVATRAFRVAIDAWLGVPAA